MRYLALCAWLFACVPNDAVGVWDAQGFHRTTHEYSIAGNGDELLEGWRIDNWVYVGDQPARPFADPENWINHRYDTSGDGEVDFSHRLPVADVLLQHAESGAALWVQLIPVEPRRDERRMRVLLREWIRNAGGARYRFRTTNTGTTTVSESRWTTLLTQENDARVDGLTAAAASFAITDVDRLQIDGAHRDRLGRAVMIATPFVHEPRPYTSEVKLRFALLVVMLADPAEYDELQSDFSAFVNRLQLPGTGQTEGVVAPAPVPAVAPALATPVVSDPIPDPSEPADPGSNEPESATE